MHRFTAKFVLDTLLWTVATPVAFLIRLEGQWLEYLPSIVLLTALGLPLKATAVATFGLYRRSWRKVGVRDLRAIGLGVGIVTLALVTLAFFATPGYAIPRSVPLIEAMLALLGLSAGRLALRLSSEQYRSQVTGGRKAARRVLIVGAGESGTLVAREMLRHPEAQRVPVGYVDDDPALRRQRFVGLPVLGAIEDLPAVVEAHAVDEVLIAMPSAPGEVVRRVVELAQAAEVEHRSIPGIYDLLSGQVSISEVREVAVEDLLRRAPVRLEMGSIASYLEGRVVLVTGAGGSIGSEIVRQVARFRPQTLLLLGRGENSIFEIDRELARSFPDLERHPLIADVRDGRSLREVFERFRPEVVFHAAAHKHVPLMEANPEQAVFNNVGGTQNLVDLALEFGVRRFVNISTDKAVNPTSVMGASKRTAELVVHRASQACEPGCAFVSVRFGNVLGSRGSVVPVFREQIRRGGPVTVTHPEMRRYFMTIPEATQLVLQAGGMAINGSVYVLDMGEPVRVVDLARDLILLSGKQPGTDVEIVFTGMRPGEKLYEELLLAEEGTLPSAHEKIFVARKAGLGAGDDLDTCLDTLFAAAEAGAPEDIRAALKALIPTYRPFEADAPPVGGDGAAEGHGTAAGDGAVNAPEPPSLAVTD